MQEALATDMFSTWQTNSGLDEENNMSPAFRSVLNRKGSGITSCNNDVVLLKDEKLLHNQWPLARVAEVFPSKDGLVCRVTLHTNIQIRAGTSDSQVGAPGGSR